MPARPLPDEALHLIAAVRDALAERLHARVDVQERTLFGCHAFMVDGKLCLGVKGDELLVRLPPAQHTAVVETPGVRELDPRGGMAGYFWIEPAAYATRDQWLHWIDAALAYNPQARATPRRGATGGARPGATASGTQVGTRSSTKGSAKVGVKAGLEGGLGGGDSARDAAAQPAPPAKAHQAGKAANTAKTTKAAPR